MKFDMLNQTLQQCYDIYEEYLSCGKDCVEVQQVFMSAEGLTNHDMDTLRAAHTLVNFWKSKQQQ